jgi:hypothetical protein
MSEKTVIDVDKICTVSEGPTSLGPDGGPDFIVTMQDGTEHKINKKENKELIEKLRAALTRRDLFRLMKGVLG